MARCQLLRVRSQAKKIRLPVRGQIEVFSFLSFARSLGEQCLVRCFRSMKEREDIRAIENMSVNVRREVSEVKRTQHCHHTNRTEPDAPELKPKGTKQNCKINVQQRKNEIQFEPHVGVCMNRI